MKSMASMKTLLRLLGAGVLTTVAATSVVACGDKDNTATGLPTAVAQDLGLMTAGASPTASVTTTIAKNSDSVTYGTSVALNSLNATTLVNTDRTAKSDASKTFLTDTLKLKAGADGKFAKADTDAVTVQAADVTINPTVVKNSGKTDFDVTGGTFSFKFTLADNTKTEAYTVNLKNSTGIVKTAGLTDLVTADFTPDATTYVTGKKISEQVSVPFISSETAAIKQVKSLQALLKQGSLTQTIISVKKSDDTTVTDPNHALAVGDKGLVTIKIGDVVIGSPVELTAIA